jgi:DNA-binding transcriptional ArsR family regulator
MDALSTIFTALADPTRRAIVERLARGDATVTELAEPFALSVPTVSRHVAVLERAGLVHKTRHAQQRSCTLEPGRLGEAEQWIAEYRRFFERRFDALEQQLNQASDEED